MPNEKAEDGWKAAAWEKRSLKVGLAPATPGLRVPCSTDWANRAAYTAVIPFPLIPYPLRE